MLFPLVAIPSSSDNFVETDQKEDYYLAKIRKDKINSVLDALETYSGGDDAAVIPDGSDDDFDLPAEPPSLEKDIFPVTEPGSKQESDFTLSGEYQVSFGIEDGDVILNRANADLSEENWRILSDQAHNRRENTFDPAIYSYIKFQVDRPRQEGWSFHSNFDFSPWSYIGTSKTTASHDGDTFDVEYRYWGNSSYTVNRTIYSSLKGDSLALPELKVSDGYVPQVTVTSLNGNILTIPESEIHYEIWPVREFWFDYNTSGMSLRVFPVGMENLAYSSDDPLSLTNNHTYWEESQWLINWQPGNFNSGLATPDFQKGWWNDSTAYVTRDSTGTRLTALRGFSLNLDSEKSMLDFTIASPKELWQDYESFNTFQSALRGKYFSRDDLTLGFVYGSKFGRDKDTLDAFNNFAGIDANLATGSNTEFFLEAAASFTEQDRSSDYQTEERGNAFQVSMINSSSDVFGKNYFALSPEKSEPFYKIRLALTHMDEGFQTSLSSYRETRDDTFWSRHLYFREPLSYNSLGLYSSPLSWDDILPFRIGDGVDYGRDTIGFRLETENLLDQRMSALFDVRNVHDVNGEFIENAARLETTYKVLPKLTTKFMGIYHALPETTAGYDPFITDPETGNFYQNSAVEGGKDPSLKTLSLGAKYDFFDWLDTSFIWERTNDCTLAYDNFGRGLLEWTSFYTYNEYGETYRDQIYGLYSSDAFPTPPYPYFDIFKVGIGIRPTSNLELYLDWARNEYEWSQIIDDNTNHIGIEVGYTPIEKLGFFNRYVYSKTNDISRLNEDGVVENESHHTFFSEVRLGLEENSELIAQYGVGSIAGFADSTYSPFGGGIATLDTQHIVRVYYRRKF